MSPGSGSGETVPEVDGMMESRVTAGDTLLVVDFSSCSLTQCKAAFFVSFVGHQPTLFAVTGFMAWGIDPVVNQGGMEHLVSSDSSACVE
eukprot:3203892-Amphidinium_carterae.1